MEDFTQDCFDCGADRSYFSLKQGEVSYRRYGPYPNTVLAWWCGLCGG